MNVNSNQWYVRWFFWNCRALDNFTSRDLRYDDPREEQYSEGTNLCQFFRVMLFGTLVSLASVGSVIYTVFCFVILPFLLFNATNVLSAVGVVFGVFVGAIGLVCICVAAPGGVEWVTKKTKQTLKNQEKSPSFFYVFCQYIIGVKKRFCPTITFKKEDSNV